MIMVDVIITKLSLINIFNAPNASTIDSPAKQKEIELKLPSEPTRSQPQIFMFLPGSHKYNIRERRTIERRTKSCRKLSWLGICVSNSWERRSWKGNRFLPFPNAFELPPALRRKTIGGTIFPNTIFDAGINRHVKGIICWRLINDLWCGGLCTRDICSDFIYVELSSVFFVSKWIAESCCDVFL